MTKTQNKETADWAKMKPSEVEKIVVELGKNGNSPQKIGLILRDEHGIPKTKLFGKRISQILKANNIEVEDESSTIKKKIAKLEKHFSNNKHDYTVQRAIMEYNSRLNKLSK